MPAERATRGRLSSLEMIPADAQHHMVWAMGELNARNRSQSDILDELNGKLADMGLDLISRSAFSRAAVRAETARRRYEERAQLVAAILPMATPDKVREADLVIGELLKTLIGGILDRETLSSEDALNLAQAYKRTIEGQTASAELRRQQEAEFAAKLGEVEKAVAKAKGITAETRMKIMEQLGVIQRRG